LDATGIHPEIHKQVYAFIENELGIKKKALKLPIVSDRLPHFVRNDSVDSNIKDWAQKYEI